MRSFGLLLVCALAGWLSGCAALTEATTSEERTVRAVSNPSRVLTVLRLAEATNLTMSRHIAFPPGPYRLEAEDDEYEYFAAPAPLDYRRIDGDNVAQRRIPGGIALAKRFSLVPAAGYASLVPGRKLLTWKLGAEFLSAEGSYWKRSFR
ncbi:MAG: hypothetical protein JSR82_18570 [Verrucomicrobia bacterium]|nr:hypothetical protein [Verrucomicrobiota bacterium]